MVVRRLVGRAVTGLAVTGLVAISLGLAPGTAAAPAVAAPARYGDCEVDVFRARPDNLVMTVRNRGSEPFGPVAVRLLREDSPLAQASTGALVAGASTVVRLPLPKDATGAYLLVSYESGGVRQEFAVSLPASPRDGARSDGAGGDGAGGDGAGGVPGGAWLAWLTPLLGFAGALLGVWLGHTTTARRERARLAADAQWKRVDRDGPAYRDFLDYWQGSVSPSHLTDAFDQLRLAATVPSGVVRQYDQTLAVLRDPRAGEDDKREAAERLRAAVDALRTHQA